MAVLQCDWCENPTDGSLESRGGATVCGFCKKHEPCDDEDGGCGGLMTLGTVIFTGNAMKGEGNYVWGTCEDCGREAKVYDF